MSGNSDDAWYYTTNGQRNGPITRAELEAMAEEKKLHPRYDHCWKQGMDRWRPAGEVDGLFKKAAGPGAPIQPTLAESPSDRMPQKASKLSEAELADQLRSAKWPGASRRVYLFGTWVLPLILFGAVAALGWFIFDIENPEDAALLPMVMGAAAVLVFAVVFYIWLLRLSNLGMSRWWFLAGFVPLLNIWLGYRTMCCPAGYEYHRKLDGIGVFLAILYWGFLLLWVLAIVLSLLGMIGVFGGAALEVDGILERVREEMERQLNDGVPSQE